MQNYNTYSTQMIFYIFCVISNDQFYAQLYITMLT